MFVFDRWWNKFNSCGRQRVVILSTILRAAGMTVNEPPPPYLCHRNASLAGCLGSQVKEVPGDGESGSEDSTVVTLTLSVYLDIHQKPFLEVRLLVHWRKRHFSSCLHAWHRSVALFLFVTPVGGSIREKGHSPRSERCTYSRSFFFRVRVGVCKCVCTCVFARARVGSQVWRHYWLEIVSGGAQALRCCPQYWPRNPVAGPLLGVVEEKKVPGKRA
jgi:hypothetical protein